MPSEADAGMPIGESKRAGPQGVPARGTQALEPPRDGTVLPSRVVDLAERPPRPELIGDVQLEFAKGAAVPAVLRFGGPVRSASRLEGRAVDGIAFGRGERLAGEVSVFGTRVGSGLGGLLFAERFPEGGPVRIGGGLSDAGGPKRPPNEWPPTRPEDDEKIPRVIDFLTAFYGLYDITCTLTINDKVIAEDVDVTDALVIVQEVEQGRTHVSTQLSVERVTEALNKHDPRLADDWNDLHSVTITLNPDKQEKSAAAQAAAADEAEADAGRLEEEAEQAEKDARALRGEERKAKEEEAKRKKAEAKQKRKDAKEKRAKEKELKKAKKKKITSKDEYKREKKLDTPKGSLRGR